ncbi:copper resistance CopC family protein [Arthrobacter castelli]|uniref:copper resistance CopC family protein n=1 Tax=Arthrobacter castelli TaxID=271431 RepID=UPI00041D059B|nr:copper resistance CopC family protein [Arthrobacter castelli]
MQHTSAIRRALATLGAVLLALLLPVSAASAHDTLTGSSPKDGQQLETMPQNIELTFSQPPIKMGSEVKVQDENGKDWATGKVEIVDNVVKQAISADAPAGEYTVTWRVVSSDSHPIEGQFTFTAASGGPGGAEAGSQEPLASDTAAAGGDSEQQEAPTTFPTTFVVFMGVLLVVLVVIIGLLARRRLGRHDERFGDQ